MIVRRRSRRRSISRFSFPFATRLVSLRDPFPSLSPLALFPSLTFTIEPPGFVGKVHPFLPASVQPSSFVQREMRAESLFSSSSPLAPPPSVYTAFEKVKGKISRAKFARMESLFSNTSTNLTWYLILRIRVNCKHTGRKHPLLLLRLRPLFFSAHSRLENELGE